MTPNKEDYLKCIYEISRTEKVTNKIVAQEMHVSPPAASEMIKKLLQDRHIQKDTVKGYLPTEFGMLIISELIRKHRLIEVFLIKTLNYSSEDVHKEAEILEHAVSDVFIDRLECFLEFPTTCPHGGTISKKGELLQEQHTQTLADAEIGTYMIGRMLDHPELLQYVAQLTLKVGDTIEIVHNDSYAQMITIKHKKQTLQLSYVIAKQLFVASNK